MPDRMKEMSRKNKSNYFFRLGINFMSTNIKADFMKRRISEKAQEWMMSQTLSGKEKEELIEHTIPDMEKVMLDSSLRKKEAESALVFAKETVLDRLKPYIVSGKNVPRKTAREVMETLGYPETESFFKEVWGLSVESEVRWTYCDDNHCGNCMAYMEPGQKYCSKCGAKRGEGAFEPQYEPTVLIYGPMFITRKYHCNACSNNWERGSMVDDEHHCPRCGSDNISITGEEDV